jgi:hypothetical protein
MMLVFVSHTENPPNESKALILMGVGTGLFPTSQLTAPGTICALPEPLE